MFSQTAEYALRAIVYLADQSDGSRTTQQIAEVTQAPVGYLAKVLQSLSRGGLVLAHRGLRGGFTLARSADEITVLDVLQAVDPIRRITNCPLGLPGHIRLCPLHRRLDQAIAMVEDALKQTTIGELLREPGKDRTSPPPLCPVQLDELGLTTRKRTPSS